MQSPLLGRKVVLFFGIEQLIVASILLYLAFDSLGSPVYGLGTSVFVFLLAGVGGATGVGLVWRAGRVTWRDDLKPLDESE